MNEKEKHKLKADFDRDGYVFIPAQLMTGSTQDDKPNIITKKIVIGNMFHQSSMF